MKKILLSLCLFASVMVGKSQTILNELYVEPSPTKSEFFELYYAGTLPIGDNVNCWTMVSYFDDAALGGRGVYVMDLPNVSTGFSNRYIVGAATNPYTVQGNTPNQTPNFNWNDMNAIDGRITKWLLVSGVWQQSADTLNDVLDFFTNKGSGGFNYSAMIFVNGQFNNGFLGGTNSTTSTLITGLPYLPLTHTNSNVCANFTIKWDSLGAFENVVSAAGQDNGYNRLLDGKCGAWVKSSSSSEHTPGYTNNKGGTTSTTGSMITSEVVSCGAIPPANGLGYRTLITFDILAPLPANGATEADDFPIDVQLWYDNFDLNQQNQLVRGTIGPNDIFKSRDTIYTVAAVADTFQIAQQQYTYIIYKTKRGCYDKVVFIPNSCGLLPVNFKSFTASRSNSTNVSVKWETATEQNAAGFAVERNIRGTWEQVAYIPSQAAGGNSSSVLTYQLNDLNAAKGISQYRIRQEDLDGAAKLSDIRSVRGEGQKGSTIVYPNPTDNGKVNIVFEGGEITKRNISVQDMSGRIVKQWNNYSNNNIQIENLSPGFYTVRIVDIGTGEQSVEKVVVNKR